MHAVGGGTRESSPVAVRDHFVESVLSSHVYVGSGDLVSGHWACTANAFSH